MRFRQPSIFSRKRQLTLALYIAASIAFFKWMNSHVTIEIEVEEGKKEGQKGRAVSSSSSSSSLEDQEEADDEEDYVFIPMTWGKLLPREFYRGSDPEWQEFVKIAKDKPRHKKIQDALVEQVFTASKKHPGIQHHLGKDLKVGKYWLDISFPDGPPQEYGRYGVAIGDTQIYWSEERITPEEQFRLTRALWPVAVVNATWAASKAVGGIHYRKLKRWLGVEDVDPFSPEERLRLALEVAEKQEAAKNQKGRRGADDLFPTGALANRTTPSSSSSPDSSDETKRAPWHLHLPIPSFPYTSESEQGQQSMDFPIFALVFQSTLHKFWNPRKMEPPRGSFVVQGMMEIRGSKGQILFDVKGCYDPAQAKYVVVQAQKKGFKSWHQRPKGGP